MAQTTAEKSHGQELLGFAHALRRDALPPDVVERATICLMDALGCGVFGSVAEAMSGLPHERSRPFVVFEGQTLPDS